ncbi:hypothetical protein ISU10_07570 [Nocardioides agariphilus]|uniref:Transcriptional regulator, AbiEi antitoxin, Type IV TA system n=1 Tax=Nocardioides agariphilus TaxID=433664 RepID=A0A930YGI7_9ACTN|nr:hypothetical protein [Nocardioides agariphilus]MBF4767621.1 hypothetical protein [Nocardioides agariphilus]
MSSLDDVMRHQRGVVARRQVEQAGERAADIARRLRRREWALLLPGVYVDHTGPPSGEQRAWAGVLYYAPSVLADESVLTPPGQEGPIVLAVGRQRNVRAREGYAVRWVVDLHSTSLLNVSPPRMRIEDAALRVAARAERELDAVQTVVSVIQRRLTTGDRMVAALERHPRLRGRVLLGEVVRDAACGSHSVLEREFLRRVESPHGLPASCRQHRSTVGSKVRYADASYPDFDTDVELDGWLFHRGAQRHHDLQRDLDSLAAGRLTIRLGWGQVFDGACQTAARLGTVLAARGWRGRPVPCGPGCPAGHVPSL